MVEDKRPDPDPDGPQMAAAKRAILREYGRVIGDQQAENIAFHVLLAARMAARKMCDDLAAVRRGFGYADPTGREVDEVCMSYRHDFGLLPIAEANRVRFEAREWYRAWMKLLDD